MYRFATTFVRTLAIVTVTSLVGCDDPDGLEPELDDVDELDELEARDGSLPLAGIPLDFYPGTLTFSIPMQPVAKFKPKSRFSLHGPTDLAYIWTPDPTGDPDAILVDANGVSPYSGNLLEVPESVCVDFLESHPFEVPVTSSTESCGAIEQGCCDRICYLWGGLAMEEYGENLAVAVTNYTFEGKEMVEAAYVDSGRMTWAMSEANGGHSSRETVCACGCYIPLVDP